MKFRGGFKAPPRMVTNMGIDMLAYPALFPETTEIRGVDIKEGNPALFGSYDFLEYYLGKVTF